MPRTVLSALVLLPWLASPAAAGECAVRIGLIEAGLAVAGVDPTSAEPDRWSSEDGSAAVAVPERGVQPRENWFGDPVVSEEAWQLLADVRELERAGDEEDCLARVEELERLLQGQSD